MNELDQELARAVRARYETALGLGKPDRTPVVIWSIGHGYAAELGMNIRDYYHDVEPKLEAQTRLQQDWPEAMLMPGVYPDFGVVTEPALLGCDVLWHDGQPPDAVPIFASIEEVDSFIPPNAAGTEMARRVFETRDYLARHADPVLIEDYGYLTGKVFMMGPLETAAMMRGYSEFLMDIALHPDKVHALLRIVVDALLQWLVCLEQEYGKTDTLIIADHFATQISPQHFDEFFMPSLRAVYAEYPEAVRVYHNEGNIEHVLDKLPDLQASVFHFGTDIGKTHAALGGRMCLMGNLDPIEIMMNGSEEQVYAEARRVLDLAARDGGYLLSTAGGMSVGTPTANIRALLRAAENGPVRHAELGGRTR